jgi:hypothetical protein
LIHHGDVDVDKGLDKGRGESIVFNIDAGFEANFAVGVVEFKVADRNTIVGAGEELGDRKRFF